MFKRFFSSSSLWFNQGLLLIRIVFALLLVYHGYEVFDAEKMKEYATWDTFKNSSDPLLRVYAGKGSEFITGILLTFGLVTRITCVWIAVTMSYITFFIGSGKFWYEDQHPFMFVLLALLFFITGAGKWSLDYFLFDKNKRKFY